MSDHVLYMCFSVPSCKVHMLLAVRLLSGMKIASEEEALKVWEKLQPCY